MVNSTEEKMLSRSMLDIRAPFKKSLQDRNQNNYHDHDKKYFGLDKCHSPYWMKTANQRRQIRTPKNSRPNKKFSRSLDTGIDATGYSVECRSLDVLTLSEICKNFKNRDGEVDITPLMYHHEEEKPIFISCCFENVRDNVEGPTKRVRKNSKCIAGSVTLKEICSTRNGPMRQEYSEALI